MEAVAAAVGGGGGEGRSGGSNNKRGRVKALDPGAEPDAKRRNVAPGGGAAGSALAGPWGAPQQNHPASRIYRVSRASGGKDRHSKVYTAKGIRDRRVRLSVATAIQFYDLQDRLGYDQPSKAIEWLIKAAAAAIDKLPSLDAAAGFPAHPASAVAKDQHQHQHHHHHTPPDADADADADAPPDADHQQQLTRSGCSSTSETSKGSVLSLSRSESRVKARERARERSAAASASARDKDKDPAAADAATKGRPATSQAASFTELLTGMAAATAAANADHKQQQQQQSSVPWQQMAAPATADYIGFAQPRKAAGHAVAHPFASPAPHLANIAPIAMSPAQHFGLASGAVTVASGGGGGEPHAEMTQFSFFQDHFMPVHAVPASAPAGDYNLNFSMSSGLVGVNSRGTLQSNSQPHISGHHHHHQQQLQRLSTSLDAPNIPSFLFSPAAAVTTPPTAENQFAAFQLWNGFQHADMKEKGKN